MPIHYHCVGCREEMYLPNHKAGQLCACPRCRLKFLAPAPNCDRIPETYTGSLAPPRPAVQLQPPPVYPRDARPRAQAPAAEQPTGGGLFGLDDDDAPPALFGEENPEVGELFGGAADSDDDDDAQTEPATPPMGYPPHGYPPQGYPPQGYPPQGYPPQGTPPRGYPPQGYPQGYPSQGYPSQGYPSPQGYPPQGYPSPQGYPPPQGYYPPPQGYPPPHGYPPPQGYPPPGGYPGMADAVTPPTGNIAVPGSGPGTRGGHGSGGHPAAPGSGRHSAAPGSGRHSASHGSGSHRPPSGRYPAGDAPLELVDTGSAAGGSGGAFTLVALEGLSDDTVFNMPGGKVYLLGRDRDADIKLLSTSVSRRQARIDATGNTPVLIDLGSANGTKVNGDSVDRHPLKVGDLIKMGKVVLRFQEA